MATQVIVVGGGLSGLSAAHTVLEHGGRVLVLDKNSFLGGNSTKATSGINGALTRTQVKLGIKDSVEAFYDDTAKSAKNLLRPELVKVLTGKSAPAVEWLQDKFGLDLSLVSQLGGHSFPRTHRGKERFPGMTITYALMEKLEDISRADPKRAKILVKARVTKLVKNGEEVVGVEYEKDGKLQVEYGVVVLSTGGYAADFTETSLLKKYRPDIYDLPTTNGDFSTGDGLKMVDAIGGNTIDLEKVQVHPTGLVDPNEPDAKVKFLAAEALRGVGGLLLTNEGQRFCDELGTRDYVTGEMWKAKKGPYRLVLNSKGNKEIEWHVKHYMGRGLMKKFDTGAALAKEIGVSESVLDATFKKYNEGAASKKDQFGKKYFHNMPFDVKDTFYVAIVTPVLHYCMGGIEINPECEILTRDGKQNIKGLFGAGELCGGVHGANRLGGSSLLGCVVLGRVAGDSACRYLLNNLVQNGPAANQAQRRLGQLATHLTGQPNSVTVQITWGENGPQAGFVGQEQQPQQQHSSAPATDSASQPKQEVEQPKAANLNKEYTAADVAKHNTEKDCWTIVNGQVLDVTSFLPDHPGGKKAILLYAGRDATEEFNMLHKPDVVEKYAPSSIIGKFKKN
jgi:flavocytochrome c